MKHSRADVCGKARLGLDIRFEAQNLTSYSGLILFQHFFSLIGIKERLWRCFRHMKANPIYGHHVMVMLLVVHLIIGHRRLRDVDYYRDDEMVKRVLGLKRLPDVSTVSRSLSGADEQSVGKVRVESSTVVMERLVAERFASVTRLLHKSWHVIVTRTPTFRVANASQNSPCSIRPCHDCRPIASVAYPHQR